MVVITVLTILIASVVKVSTVVLRNGEIRQTQAVMRNLDLAIEQFRTDSPLGNLSEYKNRYGGYPCDELEPFIKTDGIPTKPPLPPVPKFIGPGRDSDLQLPASGLNGVDQKDIKAMALAIRLYSSEGGAILDRIDAKYRRPAPLPEFFDRNTTTGSKTEPDTDDVPLVTFVDAWGQPFEYYAVSHGDKSVDTPAPSDTGGRRLKTAQFLIGQNRGRPVLVSYGPDGKDQFSADFWEAGQKVDLVADYHAADGPKMDMGDIDHRLNLDNVYLDDGLKERLGQPAQP